MAVDLPDYLPSSGKRSHLIALSGGSGKVQFAPTVAGFVRVGGVSGAAFGPVAQALDRLAHGGSEGDRIAEDFAEVEFGGFAVGGEGLVQRLDEGGIDLGAGVQFAGTGQDDGVVADLITAILFDDDVPDGTAFVLIGQVDEPEFVPPPFAQHLRWQLADVVGSGDDEHGLGLVLQPVEHGSEYPGAGAAVGGAARAGRSAKAFLDLVDPQHAGADRLGGGDDAAKVSFRLTDQATKQATGIKLEQRNAEHAGGGFGSQAFAGAGNAEHEHAFGDR